MGPPDLLPTDNFLESFFPHDWGRPLTPEAHRACCALKTCPLAVYTTTMAACAAFCLIYAISEWTCRRMSSRYRSLSIAEQAEWSSRLVSNVHAAAAVWVICLSFTSERGYYAIHPIFAHPPRAVLVLCITTGFFLFDFLLVVRHLHHPGMGGISILVHHAFYISGIAVVLHFQGCMLFALITLLGELSTPLLNVRWFLKTHGYGSSSMPYLINGTVLVFMFVLVRLILPTAVVIYANLNWRHLKEGIPIGFEVAAWVVYLFGVVLNSKWALIMLGRLLKAWRGVDHEDVPSQQSKRKRT